MLELNTYYDFLVELSKNHCRMKVGDSPKGYCDLLSFNLKNKSVSNSNIALIKNGNILIKEVQLTCGTHIKCNTDVLIDVPEEDVYDMIYQLFCQYKKSKPTRYDQYVHGNFYALKADELSFDDLLNNMSRTEARYRLEAFILLAGLSGYISWDEDRKFFWICPKDRKLVLFKDWII